MSLRLIGLRDAGNIEKERVLLGAPRRMDLGGTVLAASKLNHQGRVDPAFRRVLWLPDELAEDGDLIAIYTRELPSTREGWHTQANGRRVLRLGVGRSAPIWGGRYVPLLLELSGWAILGAE